MSVFSLLEDLKVKIGEGFTKYPMRVEGKDEVYRIPYVYIGHTPPKRDGSSEGSPPMILIRSLTGEIKQGQGTKRIYETRVGILCLAYSHESYENIEAGYNDIINMCEVVMLILNNNLYYANNKWRFLEPIKWTSGVDKAEGLYVQGTQTHPFYGSIFEATFHTEAPERKIFDIGVINV